MLYQVRSDTSSFQTYKSFKFLNNSEYFYALSLPKSMDGLNSAILWARTAECSPHTHSLNQKLLHFYAMDASNFWQCYFGTVYLIFWYFSIKIWNRQNVLIFDMKEEICEKLSPVEPSRVDSWNIFIMFQHFSIVDVIDILGFPSRIWPFLDLCSRAMLYILPYFSPVVKLF